MIKLKKSSIVYTLAFFLAFFNFPYIESFNLIKYLILLVCGIFIISKYRVFFHKENLAINIALLVFTISTVIISYLDRNLVTERDTFLASIIFAGSIIEFFLLMEYAAIKNHITNLIQLYFKISVILVIITDVLAITIGVVGSNYFVGTKFSVIYLHLMMLALYMTLSKCTLDKLKYKWIFLMSALIVFMSIYTSCMTGLLGLVTFLLVYFVFVAKRSSIRKPYVFLTVLLIACSFIFIYDSILKNENIQNFVVNVLHRKLTLTGRTNIYSNLFPLMLKQIWLGYGYGSAYTVTSANLGGYADTQNGLAQWIIQIGVIGTILLITLMFITLKKADKFSKDISDYKAMYAYIYMLAILASVEITVNKEMLAFMAIIYAISLFKFKNNSLPETENKLEVPNYERT